MTLESQRVGKDVFWNAINSAQMIALVKAGGPVRLKLKIYSFDLNFSAWCGVSSSRTHTPWCSLNNWVGSTGGASLFSDLLALSRSALTPIRPVTTVVVMPRRMSLGHGCARRSKRPDTNGLKQLVYDVSFIFVGLDLVHDLDVENGRQRADEHVDLRFLLCDKQRPALQDGERHVDGIDYMRDAEGDQLPLVGRRGVWAILNAEIGQLLVVSLQERKQATEMGVTVRFLGNWTSMRVRRLAYARRKTKKHKESLIRVPPVTHSAASGDCQIGLVRRIPYLENWVLSRHHHACRGTPPAC
uniref:Uncharacterized protein n=1 Tax=Hyaloperonospora arabidopsidis (strain Emoy2) TaxID=559515 RepID=M4BF11_HYAAE